MSNSSLDYSKVEDLGSWSEERLDRLLHESARIRNAGSRVGYISARFIGTSYKESSLIGGMRTPEKLVVNFRTFDCFTFIDSIEALRLSRSVRDIPGNLIKIRYRNSRVQYQERNHFFTDWSVFNPGFVTDITAGIGARHTRSIRKKLNAKEDGSMFVKGLEPIERTIRYIPAGKLDASILKLLRTGDYVGVTTDLPGLDVSHVGIIVKTRSNSIFRHASSTAGKVVEQDFVTYVSEKPGIIVLRPHSKGKF